MEKVNLENIYLKIIRYGTYLALLTPLVFFKDYFFPFVVPKTIFFRIIVNIIFIAYILLAFSNHKYRPRITPLTLVITIFLGVLVLTSILGVNFQRSFWSVFERMEGLLTFFHLFAFYVVLSNCFKEKKDWEKILSVSILIAFFISLYALFSKNEITKGGATIGNSSFFSAYILFNLFFSLILLFIKKNVWRIFYAISLIIFFAALFFNPLGFTKGAVSALCIGLTLLMVGWMFFSKNKLLRIISPVVLILLIFAGFFIVKEFYFKDKPFDLLSIPDRSRQIVWKIGWQSWQERPWLGWGMENFNIPFAKYYDPELPLTREIWYDRAHNIILDIGITSGIVGLISYSSIFGIAFLGLFKNLLDKEKTKIISLGLITLLLVYLLQNFWVFDMISTYIMFFLSLAFINFLIYSKETKKRVIPVPFFATASLIVLTLFILFVGNIQPARASKFVLKGIVLPLEKSISNFEQALTISPMTKFEVPEQISVKMIKASRNVKNNELLIRGFNLATKEFKKSTKQSPLDFRLNLFLGRNYNNFYVIEKDKESLYSAEKSLQRAFELSPLNQQTYFLMAETKFLQNKQEEGIELLRKAKNLEPLFIQPRVLLIKTFKKSGDHELALAELKEMDELGIEWQKDLIALREVIEILEKEENFNRLIDACEIGIKIYPEENILWQSLVNAYLKMGDKDKAKESLERFLKINPELTDQVEKVLKQIENH